MKKYCFSDSHALPLRNLHGHRKALCFNVLPQFDCLILHSIQGSAPSLQSLIRSSFPINVREVAGHQFLLLRVCLCTVCLCCPTPLRGSAALNFVRGTRLGELRLDLEGYERAWIWLPILHCRLEVSKLRIYEQEMENYKTDVMPYV